ncbi:uncharacterized protein LOC114909127 [Scleropages formosus]|uniref:uncharacterized protein LOC114909127 n=1 Tax=Scleropages formosus TaxID=113540 RepID=UPI0010FA997E|nr:uncharacterized protein LOC114909127 [Scleropages formosus]
MKRKNNRGYKETVFEKEHVSLDDLKYKCFENKYIRKNVPLLSIPVEFHVPKVTHVTDRRGLDGIIENGGFQVRCNGDPRAGKGYDFLWWSLFIGGQDIARAERRFLEERFPNRTPAQASDQEPFLHRLATSVAFQEGSRFGNFKFTFQLSDLLHEYSDQFCNGRKPTLRVFETVVYRQEILYSVVVHHPHVYLFDEYPLLEDSSDSICALRGYHFIWRAQAISDTYKFFVTEDDRYNVVSIEEMPREEYYVWQNVALAFHLPVGDTLVFSHKQLLRKLSACEQLLPKLSRGPWMSLEDAEEVVEDLKS